jgi:hypothetical protein
MNFVFCLNIGLFGRMRVMVSFILFLRVVSFLILGFLLLGVLFMGLLSLIFGRCGVLRVIWRLIWLRITFVSSLLSVCRGLGLGFFVVSVAFGVLVLPFGIVLTLFLVLGLGIVLFRRILFPFLLFMVHCLAVDLFLVWERASAKREARPAT